MGSKGTNLGGRGYLVGKLRERGLSRRQAVSVLNFIFTEMKNALRRGPRGRISVRQADAGAAPFQQTLGRDQGLSCASAAVHSSVGTGRSGLSSSEQQRG